MKRAQFGPHDWLSLPVPAGSSWLLVDTLEPETAYQFSVLAQNKLGTSSFSEVVTVNTLGRSSPSTVGGGQRGFQEVCRGGEMALCIGCVLCLEVVMFSISFQLQRRCLWSVLDGTCGLEAPKSLS